MNATHAMGPTTTQFLVVQHSHVAYYPLQAVVVMWFSAGTGPLYLPMVLMIPRVVIG